MKIFYKPAYTYFFVDILLLVMSFYVVLDWFPLTTNTPFDKYSLPSLYYVLFWIFFSYIFGRYKLLKVQKYFNSTLRLLNISLIIFIFFKLIISLYFDRYSDYVLFTITVGAFSLNYLALSLYFSYRYAIEYNEFTIKPVGIRTNATVKPSVPLDKESYLQLCSTIRFHSGNSILKLLQDNVDLNSGNTLVFASTDSRFLKYQPQYQFSTIIQLEKLNNIQGINKMLSIANEKLPDDGIFICCFESKSTNKKRFLKRYKKGLNYILYSFTYFFQRVLPKIILTHKLYYTITKGANRILSKSEVLGRLYCSGYKVIRDKKVGQLTYIIAQRVKQPESLQKRTYGPLIRLRRYGKDGKSFDVYKMRTMHPYSEYLQGYIYDRNNLKDGGKLYGDIRVTTLGRFMRKYWLDELPMIFNLLKGELKLVGVRPLSAHYFSLYSKEFQKKRVKFKPGLMPPFYADMPHTLEEIEASELRYLKACETNGTFNTDLRYFFLILKNILLKKVRSS